MSRWAILSVFGSTLAVAACRDDVDVPRSTGAAGDDSGGTGGETGGDAGVTGTAGGNGGDLGEPGGDDAGVSAGGESGAPAGGHAGAPMGGSSGSATSGAAGDAAGGGSQGGAAGSGTAGEASSRAGAGGAGGTGEGSGIEPRPFAVMGVWVDDYGNRHRITETTWEQSGFGDLSRFGIVEYDAASMYAIARNDVGNAWNPGLWSRFDWTEYDGSLWYCQTVYDAASEEDARNTIRADDSDPSRDGCGGFAWSELIPPEIVGTYVDDYGGTHEIDPYRWVQGAGSSASVFLFTQFDNDADFAIAWNGDGNAWSPGLWSRFDWIERDGSRYYCQTAYAAPTEAEALATPAADATDPTTGGCGGFAWSQLIEP